MKLKIVGFLIVGVLMVASSNLMAKSHNKIVFLHKGKNYHAKPRAKKVVVVRKSRFRPVKVIVFHPSWGPNKSFHRRWVYFPKYNCYWDNWRNLYFYKTATGWVSSRQRPVIFVNINLENENHYELNETSDENDEVYNVNE